MPAACSSPHPPANQAEGTEAHLLCIAVSARTGEGVDVTPRPLAQVALPRDLSLTNRRAVAPPHPRLRTCRRGEGTVLAGAYALEAEQKLVKACYTSSQAGRF